eukprot:scaffold205608_cov20-Tisochrysis_lutea.AAC.1
MKSGALASVPGSMLFTPVCDLFKLTDLPHPTILVSKRCVIHDISVLALHCAMVFNECTEVLSPSQHSLYRSM